MRTIAMIASIAALASGGCTSPADTPPAPRPTEQPSVSATSAEAQWTMPNLVGVTLQEAQDQIQALTGGAVHFTDSHDLSGTDRNQVMDANWQVCTQNVGPGAALTSAARLDFGVVKLDESCP